MFVYLFESWGRQDKYLATDLQTKGCLPLPEVCLNPFLHLQLFAPIPLVPVPVLLEGMI